jgi:16S rRNA G966 N2-methylase RsmD
MSNTRTNYERAPQPRRNGPRGEEQNRSPSPLVTVLLNRRPTHAKPAKLADLLCWRHLEGRTRRCVALDSGWASVDVGVGNGSAAKAAAAAGGSSAALAAAARVVAAELLKSDRALSVGTFSSGKRGATLAATRAALERSGVPLRADVGPREAAEGSVCLCLHPALELRLPLSSSSSSSSPSPVERALRQLEREGRADGVPLSAAAEVCRRALDAACELEGRSSSKSTAALSDWPPELVPLPADDDDGDNGDQRQRRRRRRPDLLRTGWCDRLHLPGASWCPAHVRWLLRLASGPCYCGGILGGHGSMDELLARAEEALAERWQRRRWRRQQQQHAPAAVVAFEWSPSLTTPPPPPEHACLFVSGLDERAPAARVRAAILAALAPVVEAATAAAAATQPLDSQPLVRVVTSKGPASRTRGWARVTVPAELAEQALAALSAPNKRQIASRSLGRADALFPLLPPASRLRLRLDPVATFSVMDQPLAEKVADLLAALAEGTATAAEAVPRHAIDACACAGGSALALSRRFARVTAIELDPDRAEDLAHNFVAAARWRRPPVEEAVPSPSRWWVELRQPEAQEEEDGQEDPPPWPPVPAERRAVVACADSLRLLLRPEALLSRQAGSALPPPPGFGGADDAPQPPPLDVVFFDPPWGGPQYRDEEALSLGDDDNDKNNDAPGATTKKNKRDCHAPVAADDDLHFGGRWLSSAAAELLASSRCRLVAVRLPARTVDARAFARKVAAAAPGAEALLAVWGRSALVVVGRASAALAPAAASPLLGEALRRHGCAPLSLHD